MGAKIWQKCLDRLEDELSSQQFNTWIRPLQAVSKDTNIKLLAPNKYIKDQVNDHFLIRTIRRQTLVRMAGESEEGAIDAGLLALAAKIQTALQAIDEEESREQ